MRAAFFLPLVLAAQGAGPLTFEVASVKRSVPGVDILIILAYRIAPFQLVGAPSWLRDDDYAIVARTPPGTVQKRERLRALLADRFHPAMHREMREMPAYFLPMAKNGPKLRESGAQEATNLRIERTALSNATLERRVGGKVIDETGLTGFYGFDVHWAPETSETGPSLSKTTVIDKVERPTEN